MTNCSLLENEDLGNCLDECLKILDENLEMLSDIQYSLGEQKEDELVPEMQLTDLIDMTYEVADSSRMKKAEFTLMQRYLEK